MQSASIITPMSSSFIGTARTLQEALIPVLRLCVPHLCHLPPNLAKDHGVNIIYQTCTKPNRWTKPKINLTTIAWNKKKESYGKRARPWREIKTPQLNTLLNLKHAYTQTQPDNRRKFIKSNADPNMFLIGFLHGHPHFTDNRTLFLSRPYRIEGKVGSGYNWHIRVFFNAKLRASGAHF